MRERIQNVDHWILDHREMAPVGMCRIYYAIRAFTNSLSKGRTGISSRRNSMSPSKGKLLPRDTFTVGFQDRRDVFLFTD